MIVTVFFGLVALAAIGVACFYRKTLWRVEKRIVEYDAICDGYRESGHSRAKVDRELTTMTKERDALAAEVCQTRGTIALLKTQVNHAAVKSNKANEAIDLVSRSLSKWTATQDEPLGDVVRREKGERASAETDGQPGEELTREKFREDVEAAGLSHGSYATHWTITGGIREPLVRVWPIGNQVYLATPRESLRRLGTLAQAIELAGPPVGTD